MYVQIVTYNLSGVSEQDYIDIAHQVAAQFASMPGLQAKVWLEDAQSNSFGAVYFWEDRESMERFHRSDLFEATYPGFATVVSEGYAVYEHLTKLTQPVLQILEEGWTAAPASPVEAPPPPAETPRTVVKQAPAKKAARKATKGAKAAKKATGGAKKAAKKSAKKATKGTKKATGGAKKAAKKSAKKSAKKRQ